MPTTYWARVDSNTANNPALNLKSDPAVQITFVPFGANGDILLETNGGSFDPDTQVLIGGTAYNFTFELAGALPTTNNNGAQRVPDQYEGKIVYVITVQNYPTAGQTTRLVFLPDENATAAEMNSFALGAISLQGITTTGPGVICFAEGTRIRTPDGDRPVETLRAGDLVMTADHGPAPVVWASATRRHWPGSSTSDIPVLIKAGAFGNGLPARDMVVSPQHKILVSHRAGARGVDDAGVLAPVKGLTALPGIRVMGGCRAVTYHHILFSRHEIVFAEGLASESFYPGPTALGMLTDVQRAEIAHSLPEIGKSSYGPPCRPVLTVREARDLVLARRGRRQRLEAFGWEMAPGLPA